MSDSSKFAKAVLVYSFIFCTALIVSALLGKMIISDTVYSPVSPEFSVVSLEGAARLLSNAVRSSSVQAVLVFFSGFSVFAFPVSAAVSVYRGASLGYTAAALSRGALITSSGITATIRDYAPVLLLYFLSGAAMILLSAVALSYSSGFTTTAKKQRGMFAYLAFFLTFSGVIFTSDALKLLFI